MKKVLSLALALAMMISALALTACGDDDAETTTAGANNNKNTAAQTTVSGTPDPTLPSTGDVTTGTITVEEGKWDKYKHTYTELSAAELDALKAQDQIDITTYNKEMSISNGLDWSDRDDTDLGSETADNLFDNNTATKWCENTSSVEAGSAIVFQTAEAIKVTGYIITTANDNAKYTERNPVQWRLYAATTLPTAKMTDEHADGGDYFDNEDVPAGWTLIDYCDASVNGDSFTSALPDEDFADVGFKVEGQETKYQYFMLLIDYVEQGTVFQMSEFHICGTT